MIGGLSSRNGRKKGNQDIVVVETKRRVRIPSNRKLPVQDPVRKELFEEVLRTGFHDYAGKRVYAPVERLRLMVYFHPSHLPLGLSAIRINSAGQKVTSEAVIRQRRIDDATADGKVLFVVESENLEANSGMWAYWVWPHN